MTKVRIGIVGVGAIATVAHLPSYAAREDVEVVAFADVEAARVERTAAKFAAQTGRRVPKVYPDIHSMLQAEALDAVSICTPNTSHVQLALAALDAGVHVLLEKPMTTRPADAEALVEKVEQTGKVLMVCMSHRYRNDVQVLKRFVDAGDLGDIYYAKTRILRRRGSPRGWFTDVSISDGGPLLDIGVHALDLTWWLMGRPRAEAVSGYLVQGIGADHLDFISTWTAHSSGNQDNEVYTTEDFAAAFIRLANGAVIQMEVSWALNGPQDDALKLELFGRRGGVSLDPLRVYGTAHQVLTETVPSVDMGPLYQNQIDHFLHCIRTGETPISDVRQGRDVVFMLDAIRRSSEARGEVRL
ncbi:oxidoreductase [Alicyclobacillus cellulosilyticus]|uniref:Oxidoreductase n=1 Tax=Alicyclobacillus cellulosilyticus TaxID=1003997 RepID=A0A917K8E5_9BACL|nr:Gfo/Idh/MocA family oxidoreductase [Alicyclobacillus cellulosilyticus]GGJ02028.1 oxidoreductase [Alicyclobacillus cellulosilyticus]